MEFVRELVLPVAESKPDLRHGSIFFIGTATVLLRYAGFTILTDPNFLHQGEHVHLGYGMRAKRLTDPAIAIKDLPAFDLVVLSHMHEDHFDRVVQRKLSKFVPIVTTVQAAHALKGKGFRATYPLKTWETLTTVKGDALLRITSMPARHAPGPLTHLLPPVMGSMLEFQAPAGITTLRLYISGDTLLNKDLKEIPRRYPGIDMAVLHLGGTKIMGVMLTMDAKQGVQAIKLIAPRVAIPVHYNDYPVFKSSLEDFQKAVASAGLTKKVKYINRGETYTFDVPVKQGR
ncbi:MAG: MBL fold metallo-hydrolase [Ktedonobacteraceae bacterium]